MNWSVIRKIVDGFYTIKRLYHSYGIYRAIRNRITGRFCTVKCKTLNKYGYHDLVEVLPASMFEIIRVFIEDEKAWDTIVWDDDEFHKVAWQKIAGAYKFWYKEREGRLKEIDDKLKEWHDEYKKYEQPSTPIYNKNGKVIAYQWNHGNSELAKKLNQEYDALEKKYNDEMLQHMHNIVDVKDVLWT